MEFIDTHTHTYDEAFAGCEDEIVARALAAGVSVQLQADVDSRERERMFALAERHPGVVRPMLGLYPGSVDRDWRREIDALEAWRGRGIVAVGEIGLDYHYGAEFKREQQEAFRVQLELAAAWDLPVNIHLREATEDFFAILAPLYCQTNQLQQSANETSRPGKAVTAQFYPQSPPSNAPHTDSSHTSPHSQVAVPSRSI